MAIPAILAGIAEPLISLADTAIVGGIQNNPTEAVGAIGLAGTVFSLLVWSLAQLRTAVSALISQALGRKSLNSVKHLVAITLNIALLTGLFFSIVTFFGYGWVVDHFFDPDNATIRGLSIEYMDIRIWGLPISLFVVTCFGIFRGFQNTLWAMYIGLGGGLMNIMLDLILVYGVDGLVEPMGVKGAAIASVTAQAMMAIVSVVILRSKTPFSWGFVPFRHPHLRTLIVMTWHMFVRTIVLNITFLLANRYAAGYGKDQLAAYTIGMNIWLFSSFFIDGYSSAGNAIGGRLLGGSDYSNLKKVKRQLVSINIGIASGLGLLYFILQAPIINVFTDDRSVQDVFFNFFWLVVIAQPLNAIAFTLDGIFKGMGETKYLRNTLIWATFGAFIPTLLILDLASLELLAVWLGFICWMLVRAGSLWVRFDRKYAN